EPVLRVLYDVFRGPGVAGDLPDVAQVRLQGIPRLDDAALVRAFLPTGFREQVGVDSALVQQVRRHSATFGQPVIPAGEVDVGLRRHDLLESGRLVRNFVEAIDDVIAVLGGEDVPVL